MKTYVLWAIGGIVAAFLLIACSSAAANPDKSADNGPTPTPPPDVMPSPDPGFPAEGGLDGREPVSDPGSRPTTPATPRVIDPDRPVDSGDLPRTLPPPAATPSPFVPGPGQRIEIVPAPIDNLQLVARSSAPARYSLIISAGLPSGCAQRYTHEVRMSDTTIRVDVLNRVLTGDVACTAIYGMYELTIDLGPDLKPGVEYTVTVNDKQLTFVAQ